MSERRGGANGDGNRVGGENGAGGGSRDVNGDGDEDGVGRKTRVEANK